MFLVASMLLLAGADVPPQAPAGKPARPKMHCETVEQIGTRLGSSRVCMTEDQWLQKKHDSQDALDARQRGVPDAPKGG